MSRRECRSTPCKGPRPIPRLRASLVRGTYQSAASMTYIFYPIGRLVNFIYSMLWNRLAQLFVASWRKRQRPRRWSSIPRAHRARHREHSEAIHFAKALPKLDCLHPLPRGFAMTYWPEAIRRVDRHGTPRLAMTMGLRARRDCLVDASKNPSLRAKRSNLCLARPVNAGLPHPLCGFAMTIIRLFELSERPWHCRGEPPATSL